MSNISRFILPLVGTSIALGLFLLAAVPAQALVVDCALVRPGYEQGYCDDVNDVVLQVIVIAEFLLGIAGSIALLMFIYGGFMYLTAFGKSEQAKKGQQVVIAAAIGLVVAFSAYLIVDFVVAGLGVSSYFTG